MRRNRHYELFKLSPDSTDDGTPKNSGDESEAGFGRNPKLKQYDVHVKQ
jgi:hypothetical protein